MHPLLLWTALLIALLAAYTDLRSRRIPDWLTLGAVGVALALQAVVAGPAGLEAAVWGIVAVGLPAAGLFALRAMGGGDVKLLAACGALLGPSAGIELLLVTALAGGGLALVTVLSGRAWKVTAGNLSLLFRHWRARGLTPCPAVSLGRSRGFAVPYGVAVACGMVFTVASRAPGF